MYTDKALYDLINLLIISNKSFSITKLAEKIAKSRRIVYYNIDKINIEFSKSNIDLIINQPRKGIILNTKQKEFLKNLITNKEYVLSKIERELAINLLIATHPQKQTLDALMNTFLVSKNSILADIDKIKSNLKSFNNSIKIVAQKKGGYRLVGNELVQIQYIYMILKKIFELKNYKYIEFIQNLYQGTSIVFSDEFVEVLINEFLKLQEKLGKKVSAKETQSFVFSFPYLYLFSIKTKNIEKELIILKDRLEYKIIKDMLNELYIKFNLEHNDKIIMLFTLILLCTGKIADIHNTSKDYDNHRKLANDLVRKFEILSNTNIVNKDEIVDDVVTYLKVMFFRKKYNIISHDININKVKKEYKYIFETIKKISKMYSYNLNDEDLSVITLSFARVYNEKNIKVLIVTDEGKIIKKLLETKLKKYISNIKIVDIVNKSEIEKYDISSIDLILSTENEISYKKDIIYIDYLLNKDDLLNIFMQILKITENI